LRLCPITCCDGPKCSQKVRNCRRSPSKPLYFIASSPFVALFSDNYFHTSSISCSQASKRINARNKKKNIARTEERIKQASASKPSVVLGTRPTEEAATWGNCKLSKVTVTEEQLSTSGLHTEKFSVGNIEIPKELGYGVNDSEKKMLFDDLPIATIHMITQVRQYAQSAPGSTPHGFPKKFIQTPSKEMLHEENEREIHKATLLAKAIDLRNANADGIAFENRRRIIEAFSTPENPFDSGRTEVQGACILIQVVIRF